MSFRKATVPILAALAVVAGLQAQASAQREGTSTQRADNLRATADLKARIETTDARITTAQRGGKITRTRATALRRQVSRTQASMTRLSRQQGFISAAELASYERTLAAIDVELDRRGVERSYGNDMLPSAETIAFQKVDARLKYRNARIEYDARSCAVYQGTARDGRVRTEPLLSPEGRPICTRR
ncbi:hypothetical protein [Sphingomonas sp. NFX23]|uniref:hypothetical protein n=1 Tax=Sphingomonas sp. NFX23 TaxID=2819532 RepID=UPI003CF46638